MEDQGEVVPAATVAQVTEAVMVMVMEIVPTRQTATAGAAVAAVCRVRLL
jgi:hypothetical protein